MLAHSIYRSGLFWTSSFLSHVCECTQAIKHYSAALDVLVPASDLLSEGPRRAVTLTNRAAAYLARAATGGGKPGTFLSS